MPNRLWTWLLVTALSGSPHLAAAADVVLGGDPEMECYATLSGVITRGDFERVSAVLEGNYSGRGPVCLDSPGGLWSEGLALMELFYERSIPTAVAAGARCESACAIAFLGGSSRWLTVVTSSRARLLHIDGHLGFHAPYLDVPEGQYDEVTVLAAFERAMAAVTELTAWSERLALSDDFLVTLFNTGREEMYLIDTVGKAADLSIHLVGHVLPQELTEPMIREACRQSSTFFGAGWDRIDGSASIQNAFRIQPNQSGTHRGVAVAEYGIESWSGWYVCAVGYNPPWGAVPAPDGGTLASHDGGRGILYVQVSDDPIQQWDDPMSFAPDPSLSAILQAAEPLSEIFNNEILSETVFPADTPIRSMRTPDWIQDPPARLVGSGGYAAPTSRQAAMQFMLDYNSFWDHNGSRMGLVAEGARRRFHYVLPRAALAERGVTPGTLLFEGERVGDRYEGLARIFASQPCGVFTYPVAGPVAGDNRSVTMYGRAPRVNNRCEITGYRDDTLIFTLE